MTETLPIAPAQWSDEDLARLPPQLRDRELLAWLWVQDAAYRRERRKGHYIIQFNHDPDGVPRSVNLTPHAPHFTVKLGPLSEIP